MPSFSALAADFRAQIAKFWSIQCDLSPSMAMKQVVEEAVSIGLLSEYRELPGHTFTDWVLTGRSPAWAAQSILCLLLKSGWVPATESAWAGVAAILVRTGEPLGYEDYLARLRGLAPTVDHLTAAGWIHAALVDKQLFVYEKTLKHRR
jgi:hypothetical protein